METTINASVYGIAVPCAASAVATLEVRGAAVRNWDAATRGMKRTGFVPAHTQGSLAWSPPL